MTAVVDDIPYSPNHASPMSRVDNDGGRARPNGAYDSSDAHIAGPSRNPDLDTTPSFDAPNGVIGPLVDKINTDPSSIPIKDSLRSFILSNAERRLKNNPKSSRLSLNLANSIDEVLTPDFCDAFRAKIRSVQEQLNLVNESGSVLGTEPRKYPSLNNLSGETQNSADVQSLKSPASPLPEALDDSKARLPDNQPPNGKPVHRSRLDAAAENSNITMELVGSNDSAVCAVDTTSRLPTLQLVNIVPNHGSDQETEGEQLNSHLSQEAEEGEIDVEDAVSIKTILAEPESGELTPEKPALLQPTFSEEVEEGEINPGKLASLEPTVSNLGQDSHNHSEDIVMEDFTQPTSTSGLVNPCDFAPGLWLVKIGYGGCKILKAQFYVKREKAAEWNLRQDFPSQNRFKSKISLKLLCLPTQTLQALDESLNIDTVNVEEAATQLTSVGSQWPIQGSLIIQVNSDKKWGQTWMPSQLSSNHSEIDITDCIGAGYNTICFIQLADLSNKAFIILAMPASQDSQKNISAHFHKAFSIQSSSDPLVNISSLEFQVSELE